MNTLTLGASLVGAAAVVVWRIREAQTPVSLPKIVMPPVGMSTGFCMFLYEPTRVPLEWAIIAFVLGAAIFAYPMLRTSRLTVKHDQIFVLRSKAFLWVLLALLAVRIGLRGYVEDHISPLQTGALFYLLAFGMVVRWRVSMLLEYLQLRSTLTAQSGAPPVPELT